MLYLVKMEVMKIFKESMIKGKRYLYIEEFEKLNIFTFFSTIDFDFSSKNRSSNLNFIKNTFKINMISSSDQTHSDNIKIIENSEEIVKNTDALITNKSNIYLFTLHADCTPIYILDKKNRIVALIHSGWRGTHKKILEKTLKKMLYSFNSKPEDIIVAFGPSIRKDSFEVDYDVYKLFKEKFENDIYYEKKDNKYLIDLPKINTDIAKKFGVSQIIDSNICTYEDKRFYSFRKTHGNEKMGAIIGIKNH